MALTKLSPTFIDGSISTAQLPAQLSVSSSAAAGALTIDASGRGTMSGQPAFMVYNISRGPASGIQTYNTTHLNRGNHMNTANGTFTVPIAGTYFIQFHALTENDSTSGNVEIQVNGGFFARNYVQTFGGNYHRPVSIGVVASLAANDTVRVSTSGNMHGNQSEFFSGYLLG